MATSKLFTIGFMLLFATPATAVQVDTEQCVGDDVTSFLQTSLKANSFLDARKKELIALAAETRLRGAMSQLASAVRRQLRGTDTIYAADVPLLAGEARNLLAREAGKLHSKHGADLMRNYAAFAPDLMLVGFPIEGEEPEIGDFNSVFSRATGSPVVRDQKHSLHKSMNELSDQMSDLGDLLGPVMAVDILGSIFKSALPPSLKVHKKIHHTAPAQKSAKADEDDGTKKMIDTLLDTSLSAAVKANQESDDSSGALANIGPIKIGKMPKEEAKKQFMAGWNLGRDLADKIIGSSLGRHGPASNTKTAHRKKDNAESLQSAATRTFDGEEAGKKLADDLIDSVVGAFEASTKASDDESHSDDTPVTIKKTSQANVGSEASSKSADVDDIFGFAPLDKALKSMAHADDSNTKTAHRKNDNEGSLQSAATRTFDGEEAGKKLADDLINSLVGAFEASTKGSDDESHSDDTPVTIKKTSKANVGSEASSKQADVDDIFGFAPLDKALKSLAHADDLPAAIKKTSKTDVGSEESSTPSDVADARLDKALKSMSRSDDSPVVVKKTSMANAGSQDTSQSADVADDFGFAPLEKALKSIAKSDRILAGDDQVAKATAASSASQQAAPSSTGASVGKMGSAPGTKMMTSETHVENGKRITHEKICENGHCKTIVTTEDIDESSGDEQPQTIAPPPTSEAALADALLGPVPIFVEVEAAPLY